jgi:hypothetical protein
MDTWEIAAVRARLHQVIDELPARGLDSLLGYLEEVVKEHRQRAADESPDIDEDED